MKTYLYSIVGGLSLLGLTAFTYQELSAEATGTDTNVYICTGTYSKKYHYKKTCRGLNACKSDVKQVTLTKAKQLERTLCGWED